MFNSEKRNQITKKEEKLLKILGKIGYRACKRKRKKDSRWGIALKDLCEKVDLNFNEMSESVKLKGDQIVSQVCRAGSRFTKNCICVQFEEDSDELMIWAVKKGALAVVTCKQIDNLPCIVVEKPTLIYSLMCNYYRNLSKVDVTAVVGSIGKTTTKRMISAVYNEEYKTFCDPENENQLDCVGYICQHIPRKTEKLVQEVSEDTPGCVKLISNMIKPNIVVITAIDKSHIEAFGNQEKILEEIKSITSGITKQGVVVVNIDDEESKNIINGKNVVSISINNHEADYYAEDIDMLRTGLKFYIVEKEKQIKHEITLSYIYAQHNIYSALYAFVTGVLSGISTEKIVKGLRKYRTVGIRQNVYKIRSNTLYVDCYNAAIKSVKAAIKTASKIYVKNRKIAVLGDIEETGEHACKIHKEILQELNNSKFDVAILYGKNLSNALKETDLRKDLTIIVCEKKADIKRNIKKLKLKNDLILFKASRKSALEDVIKQVYPISYRLKMYKYFLPIIKWRIKVTRN